jgi:hypothetical protein
MEGPMVRAREFRFVVVTSDYEAAMLLFRDVFEFEALMDLEGQTGAKALAAAVDTPWRDRNQRFVAKDGLQLTLFQSL